MGSWQRERTCASKLDPYPRAGNIRPRSSAACQIIDISHPQDSLKFAISPLLQQDGATSTTLLTRVKPISVQPPRPPPTTSHTMDYSYFSAPPQQAYHHFVGISSHPFPHTPVDADTIRSIVGTLRRTRRDDAAPHSAWWRGDPD